MNWDRVEGNWKDFKGKVQQKWGQLTDDDLDVIEGNRQELAGRLQQRYGLAEAEAEREIEAWLRASDRARNAAIRLASALTIWPLDREQRSFVQEATAGIDDDQAHALLKLLLEAESEVVRCANFLSGETLQQATAWDRIEGNWKQFKGKIQQKWGELTNHDLDVIAGTRMEVVGRLQERYGVAKDDAEREIDTWLKNVR